MIKPEAKNPRLNELKVDYLYHLGLDSSMDLKSMFSDTKFVCMGGSPDRALKFALLANQELNLNIDEAKIKPYGKTERFVLYKVGPIISVSHGIGMPSMLILLHEITKLIEYAKCAEVKFIRIGTSGGVGVKLGEVVVAVEGLNGQFQPYFENTELGEIRKYPTKLDPVMAQEIIHANRKIKVNLGWTMGTNDFYEGQFRHDGALKPNYSEEEKRAFIQKAHKAGVTNIEMESTAFAAFCHRAGISGALVCHTIVDRLEGDQITSTAEELENFAKKSQLVTLNYIKTKL